MYSAAGAAVESNTASKKGCGTIYKTLLSNWLGFLSMTVLDIKNCVNLGSRFTTAAAI